MLFAKTKAGKDISWKQLIEKRVERFLNGEWEALWKEATSAEYSAYSYADLKRHQLEALAQERGNHGDIKGAVNALRAGQTLLISQTWRVGPQPRHGRKSHST